MHFVRPALVCLTIGVLFGSLGAQAQTFRSRSAEGQPIARIRALSSRTDLAEKERLNAWTVGLAAGRIEGAPLLFASELARVLDDGDNMRILPIVTRGPFDNVYDLLYLRGVDAAIVYGDVLDHFKNKPRVCRCLATHELPIEPVSLRGARVRASRNQFAAGFVRKGRELQHAGNGGSLLWTHHLQAIGHRSKTDLLLRTTSPWKRCGRVRRWRPRSGYRPSRWHLF